MTTTVQTLPRTVLTAYLRAGKLPVTAVGRLTGQADNAQWPPALAYETFEGRVETVVGSLLHDEVLVEKGRLRQARLAQLRTATELETLAEQTRVEAEQTFQERQRKADEQRVEAERRAEQREAELQRQAELHEQKIEAKAAKKAAAARRTKAARDSAIDTQERAAKLEALDAESDALGTAKEAIAAEDTVEVIEETLEGTKAARRTR